MAEAYGWTYEKISGSLDLIEKMLVGTQTTDEILFVEPHHAIEFDAVTGTLSSHPLWEDRPAKETSTIIFADDRTRPSAANRRHRIGHRCRRHLYGCRHLRFQIRNDAMQGQSADHPLGFHHRYRPGPGKTGSEPTEAGGNGGPVHDPGHQCHRGGRRPEGGPAAHAALRCLRSKDYPHEPKALVPGRLSITGEEIEPVDASQVRQIVNRMVEKDRVNAFAVSGFAGAINPDHEMTVKRIIRSETGLFVTCGHELSSILDFKIRATTAVLNARIVPRLGKLIANLEKALKAIGIPHPSWWSRETAP
jgi:hypothetical protein